MTVTYYLAPDSLCPVALPARAVLTGRLVSNPTAEQLLAAGWTEFEPPLPPESQTGDELRHPIDRVVADILAAWARLGIREVPADWDAAIAAARALADAPGADRVAILETVTELLARRIALAEAGGTWADVIGG